MGGQTVCSDIEHMQKRMEDTFLRHADDIYPVGRLGALSI